MTRQDYVLKWLIYALALLPVWWLDTFVLNRFPVFGVSPMLLPVAAVVVGALEGTVGGAGFGLFAGILSDAVYFGGWGGMTLALCLMGWGAGAAAQYVLSPSFGGCFLCAAAGLALLDLARVLSGLFTGLAPLPGLLRVAVAEMLWSLCFVGLLYPWFSWVKGKIGKMLRSR